jgi:hypothetical protein
MWVFSAFLILAALVSMLAHENVRSECLRAGYPEYRIAMTLEAYCVKRLDQTDIVVPFSERATEDVR